MAQRSATYSSSDTALLMLRLAAGAIFFAHGYQKFFGMGVSGVSGFFSQLGVPLPGVLAPAVATLETFGGIALVLGLLTRFVAPLFVLDMAGAILFFHWKNGFFLPKGIEFVMLLMSSAAVLALMGAGSFSVDALLSRTRASRQER